MPHIAEHPALVDRPRLLETLNAKPRRRLIVLSGGAGFGKTSLVRAWLAGIRAIWVTVTEQERRIDSFAGRIADAISDVMPAATVDVPRLLDAGDVDVADPARAEALARLLAGELEAARESRGQSPVVVLDDVHELSEDAGAMVGGLVRQLPPGMQVVIVTRTQLPFPTQRLRASGDVLELTAADLAFDEQELEQVMAAGLGRGSVDLAPEVMRLTEGWPAAVRLVVESLRPLRATARAAAIAATMPAGQALFDYMAEEVLAKEPPGVVDLVRTLAPFDEADLGLCAALGLTDAAHVVADLERRGLFVARIGATDRFTLHGLVRAYALDRLPLEAQPRSVAHEVAAHWYEERGEYGSAIAAATVSGSQTLVARLVVEHAPAMLSAGRASAVIAGVEGLPPANRTFDVELALADALAHAGRVMDAIGCLERLAGGEPGLRAPLAWRMARIHYQRGDHAAASEALKKSAPAATDTDAAMVLAYTALLQLFGGGGNATAAAIARRAVESADASPSDEARSTAHMVASYTLRGVDGPRARHHFQVALDAAERTGDVVQIVRLRDANDETTPLDEQLATATESLALIEASGSPTWISRVLITRGLVALDLGRLDEAGADLGRARQVAAGIGAVAELTPIGFLSELARIRGDIVQASSGFRQVIDGADRVGDADIGAYARAGLARILARTEADAAQELIDQALRDTSEGHRQDYLVAAGWVAACQDRAVDARRYAHEAIAAIGNMPGHSASLASAIEVDGVMADDSITRMSRLGEAAAIWRRIDNRAALAATELALAVYGDGPSSAAAERSRRSLAAAGVRESAAEAAGLLALLPAPAPAPVALRVLGGFTVLREGRPVPIGDWKSRKPRDLLKILVTRAERRATRDELMELLWPDEPADTLPNRLSVALSLLRTVLDPARIHASDHYVGTQRESVVLRASVLSIDLDDFVAEAREGLAHATQHRDREAEVLLTSAEARYAGDVLPEDAFSDWAIDRREEVRALYLQVAHALADLQAADPEAAARYLMRAISVDPFDEAAHLDLVRMFAASRRHGEARRAYQVYVARMRELDVEPAPYPAQGTPTAS